MRHTLLLSSFQSTLPSQGATFFSFSLIRFNVISIHAPLTGSDSGIVGYNGGSDEFQSTLPSQGATRGDLEDCGKIVFQSTLPSQGATGVYLCDASAFIISIHAPLTGSDGRYAQTV